MTIRGRILRFDSNTGLGEVGYDLEVLKFHWTTYQGNSFNSRPTPDERVLIRFDDNYRVLRVESLEHLR